MHPTRQAIARWTVTALLIVVVACIGLAVAAIYDFESQYDRDRDRFSVTIMPMGLDRTTGLWMTRCRKEREVLERF